ncbi:MAG: hypothetical protein K1000chlam2_00240 [Chlamydiae bacterium]|nr:hypothetical protein [Chlamydiota bacterium]
MITATILTKNSEKTLKATLDSLTRFPEVIVLDSGSTDDTLKIATQYPNVTIHTSPFLGFGPMHNYATKLSSHDWILSIDSDEILTPELIDEILSLTLDPENLYKIDRHNFYNGKRIKWCGGWHPDFVSRLYHRKKTRFSEDLVHEKVVEKGLKVISLKKPLHHTPYQEIGDFLDKMQLYTRLFAEQRANETGSVWQALFHGWGAFIKSYIFKRGIFGGKEGFIISMYNGHTAFYKYLRIALNDDVS